MKKFVFICLGLVMAAAGVAQSHANYDGDIQTIKQYDQQYAPLAHPIVFVGSSSIRKWNRLQLVFGNYNVLNRGIGGAVVNDITYYVDDLVFAYQPRQIVLYVGENDLPNPEVTADTVFNRTKKLLLKIRARLPEMPIAYIAIKPSPSRDAFREKAIAANTRIKNYLKQQKNMAFIDIFTPMIKDGKSRPELFGEDMLHLNESGYKLWESIVRPYLSK